MENWNIVENVFLPYAVDAGWRENAAVKSPGQTEIDDNPRVAKKDFLHAAGVNHINDAKT